MKQIELKNIAEYSILSRNHATGKVIAHNWSDELIDKITKAYSLGTRKQVEEMLLEGNPVNCPNATFTLVDTDKLRDCPQCKNVFVFDNTYPTKIYCSSRCRIDHDNFIMRDNEGNIVAGRMRHAVNEAHREFRKGQTIDITTCLESSLSTICDDTRLISDMEHTGDHAVFTAEIVFVDDNGNQYEYDGVSISDGKLKVSIKPTPRKPLPRIQHKYFNFENQKTIDLLPFNQDTLEKIRLERECMEKDVEGSIMNRSEIWHYLSTGFTITTYQADYVIEGENFSYDE